jgi:DNA polymerase-3 subunit epsilon
VRVRRGAVRRGETFDAIVNPGRPIPQASVRFHGITDAMVAEAPPIDVVLPAFLRFARGAVLVGHQVSFDLRFLRIETERLGLPALQATHPVLDTLLLSEAVHGPLGAHGLDAVADRLGVAVRGRHSALGDALATAEVFVRLVELLGRRGVRTLGEAVEASRRARGRPPHGSGSAP